MKLVINRPNWFRGEGGISSKLLLNVEDGTEKMCCLGFYALACGLKKKQIKGVPSPGRMEVDLPKEMDWLTQGEYDSEMNSNDGVDLMRINDEVKAIPDAREADISRIFAKHGVEVEFTDEPIQS